MTGEILRNYLKTKKLRGNKISLTDLAKSLGLSSQALNSRLNKKALDMAFLGEVAGFLGMETNELIIDLTSPMGSQNIEEPGVLYGETIEQKYLKCLEQRNRDQQTIIELQQKLLEKK